VTDIAFLFNGDDEEEEWESGDLEMDDILCCDNLKNDSRQLFLARPAPDGRAE
jgi:hypothetical protein